MIENQNEKYTKVQKSSYLLYDFLLKYGYQWIRPWNVDMNLSWMKKGVLMMLNKSNTDGPLKWFFFLGSIFCWFRPCSHNTVPKRNEAVLLVRINVTAT